MKKLMAVVKKLRIVQVLTVLLAGIFVFFSTPASYAGLLDFGKPTADQVRDEVPDTAETSRYEGGMNNYRDTDPRRDTSAADAKAKGLVDRAERNLSNRTGNPVEAINRALNDAPDNPQELGRNIKRGAEDIAGKAERAADRLGDKAEAGSENLKDKAREGAKGAARTVEEATQGAKKKVSEGANNVKRAVDKATSDFD